MSSGVLFEEIQPSGNKQLRDFSRVVTIIFLIGLGINLYLQKGEFGLLSAGLVAGVLIAAAISIASYTKMITQIRNDGIYVRFPPFQPSFNKYEWNNIRDIYIRDYDPLSEYGGWGIRTTTLGKGYILPGTTGIQIVFTDKTRLLINTRESEKVSEILQHWEQFKNFQP